MPYTQQLCWCHVFSIAGHHVGGQGKWGNCGPGCPIPPDDRLPPSTPVPKGKGKSPEKPKIPKWLNFMQSLFIRLHMSGGFSTKCRASFIMVSCCVPSRWIEKRCFLSTKRVLLRRDALQAVSIDPDFNKSTEKRLKNENGDELWVKITHLCYQATFDHSFP